jgi:hypothetical protein
MSDHEFVCPYICIFKISEIASKSLCACVCISIPLNVLVYL